MMLHVPSVQLPALGPIAPPPGTWGAVLTALQCSLVVSRFPNEINNPALYSKFAADTSKYQDPIPSRQGMFIAYFPACLVGLYQYIASSEQNVAALLLFIHFAKRLLEVLFLHKFSGTMSKAMAGTISTFYALDTLLVGGTAQWIKDVSPFFLNTGIALFVIGEFGNFYHHYLLATLRKNNNKTSSRRYVPPTGGLFLCVATPHYFFELISWLGIAFTSQQINAFIEVLSHASYLMGRASNTNDMYRKTFTKEEWPQTRKNIFPFIY